MPTDGQALNQGVGGKAREAPGCDGRMSRGTDLMRGKLGRAQSLLPIFRGALKIESDELLGRAMSIRYDHSQSPHTIEGAAAALSYLFVDNWPKSLLDAGCGIGTWLKCAIDFGVTDVCGVDGIQVDADRLLFPKSAFRVVDLRKPFHLNRSFDLVICLEVAEHLPSNSAEVIINSLISHGETILFSAACPNQPGQYHVNCQWPEYWQQLFNLHGHVCDDSIRWQIWRDTHIEPWYRQNMFIAKYDPAAAGNEPRLIPVIHPEMMRVMTGLSRHLPPPLTKAARRMRSLLNRRQRKSLKVKGSEI
jgi:SAM-dependent methyltransferase